MMLIDSDNIVTRALRSQKQHSRKMINNHNLGVFICFIDSVREVGLNWCYTGLHYTERCFQ